MKSEIRRVQNGAVLRVEPESLANATTARLPVCGLVRIGPTARLPFESCWRIGARNFACIPDWLR